MKLFSFASCSVRSTAKPRKFGWRGGAAARFLMGMGIAGVILSAGTTGASAAAYNWDPTQTGSAAGGGAGTWNTTLLNWYNGTTDVVWPNTTANTSVFGGPAGIVGLGTNITTGGLTFNTAGYTIATGANTLSIGTGGITTSDGGTGTTTITGTVASVGSQTWTVGAGDTLQFGATFNSATAANTFQLNSAGTTNITGNVTVTGKSTLSGGGIINLSGTEAFETSAGDYAGIANATVNNTAGTATFTPGTANSFFVGNTGSATQASMLSITGGSVVIGNGTRIFIGDGFSGTNVAGDGTLNVGGGAGAALFTTGTTTNASNFLGNASATGTINLLTNGTFATNRNFAAGATGKGIVNFNGGIFQATGTAAALASTITAPIAEGGATIDSQTFAITLANSFTHGGTAATDGGLTLTSSAASGKGIITLSGILSQTGGLTVNTGATISGNNTYAGLTAVNAFVDGKTSGNIFGATGAGNGTTINSAGTLRFRDTGNTTIPEAITLNGGALIDYNDPGTTTYSGPITLNTSSTIQVQPQAQASTTTAFSGGFAEGGTASSLTLTRNGAAAANSNDTVNLSAASTYGGTTTISDQLTNTGTFTVALTGGDNRLPTTTAVTLTNSQLALGNAAGASNQTVTGITGTGAKAAVVGGNATVSTLTVNNAAADTYASKLGGTGTNNNNLALTKSGAGTLTLTGASTYTGGTTVSAGTLALAAASADGTGALVVSSGGTTTVTVANALGGGAVTLSGGTLSNANTGAVGAASNTQTSGPLTLTAATSSVLDFGAANTGATFSFADSLASLSTGTLTVQNWLGNPGTGSGGVGGGGLDQFFIGTTYDLTSAQLSDIVFAGYSPAAFQTVQLASGEVTVAPIAAAPEPSAWAALLIGALGLGGLSLKARRRTLTV